MSEFLPRAHRGLRDAEQDPHMIASSSFSIVEWTTGTSLVAKVISEGAHQLKDVHGE
jgi:hypothetical protein